MIEILEQLYLSKRHKKHTSKDPAGIYSEITNFTQKNVRGQNLLHIAVMNLDLLAIQFLLDKNVSIESDKDGNTLLHALSRSPYLNDFEFILDNEQIIYEIAKLLLDSNIKPWRMNDFGKKAYLFAAEELAFPILKAIAESGTKMDVPMPNGMNLMHYIMQKNSYYSYFRRTEFKEKCIENTIEALMESGLDPEDKDAFGYTPVFYARRSDALGVVAILTGQDRATPPELILSLKEALANKLFVVADKILENGADINEVDDERKMTLLMWFCYVGDHEVVKYLISNGADIDYKEGSTGETAMSIYFKNSYPRKNYLPIFNDLCNGCKDINTIIDDGGNTALNLLCKQQHVGEKHTKMVELLVDKGANVDIPDLEGLTPIMSFAQYNGRELELNIIEILVSEGADVAHIDRCGDTVLSYAALNEFENDARKIAEIVLKKDKSIANFINKDGETPLDQAVERGNGACAKTILMNM